MENIEKEASAQVLAKVLKDWMNQPNAVAAQYIYGLLTPGEIEDLLKRNDVRKRILEEISKEGKFSTQKVAAECKCSSELVGRVWDAIADEYPTEPATSGELRVAIPKEERAQKIVKEILAENGFYIKMLDKGDKSGAIIDIRNGLEPIPYQLIRGPDIPAYLKVGAVQAAFLGSDRTVESSASAELAKRDSITTEITDCALYFRSGAFRMSLAVPKDKAEEVERIGLDWFICKTIATSYPSTLERQLSNRNNIFDFEILTLKGGVEQAVSKLGADAILDIIETGESLRKNGLVEVNEPFYYGCMNLLVLKQANRPKVNPKSISRFLDRLTTGAIPK